MNLLIKYEMGLFIASYKVNEMCKIYIFKLFNLYIDELK